MIPARRWLPPTLLIALLGGFLLVQVQRHLDTTLGDYRVSEQLLYLRSGEWVKRLSLGYNGLMACIYWTRVVQHYGREHIAKGSYPLLYPLLDITTTLDPDLLLAYRFGAIFLAEKPPDGPGRPDQAVALLRKGIRQFPDYWRFWYDMGFVYYRSGDYQRAAQAFATGAQNPKADTWMRIMAVQVRAEGGDPRQARFLWEQLYKSTDDPTMRQSALYHLYGLQVDDDIRYLQQLLQQYEERTGQKPTSFQPLVASGLLRELPRDPLGFPYQLNPDGKVLLDPRSPIITSTLGKPQ